MIHKKRDRQSLGDKARIANPTELLTCAHLGDVPRVDKYHVCTDDQNSEQPAIRKARNGQSLGDVARVATELLLCTYLGDVPRIDKYHIYRVQMNNTIQTILGFARQQIDNLWTMCQE